MEDWNEMNTDEYIKHLEQKFMFDSSGTAKAVFELISTYKALIIQRVINNEVALIEPLRNFIRSKHLSKEWETFLKDYERNL